MLIIYAWIVAVNVFDDIPAIFQIQGPVTLNCTAGETLILFRHRIEVLREIALRLRELSVLPPFRANATVYMSSEHFQQ